MKILLAVDDKCSEETAQTLAAQAAPSRVEVRVLHVMDAWNSGRNVNYPGVEHSWDAFRKLAADLVERTADLLRSKGFTVTTAVEIGDPKSEIVEAAEKWGADLILLGSRDGQRLRHFLMGGSILNAVMRHAHCSVEIVRTLSSAPRLDSEHRGR
jgi:nucleotide-binding universal stress UspA family protein